MASRLFVDIITALLLVVIVFSTSTSASDDDLDYDLDDWIRRNVGSTSLSTAPRDVRSSSSVLSYSVDEQLPVGTVVAELSRDVENVTSSSGPAHRCRHHGCSADAAAAVDRHGGRRRRRYVLITRRSAIASGAAGLFALNSTSGRVTTADVIDRELVCFRRDVIECVVSFDLVVQTDDVIDMFKLEVGCG